MCVCTPTGQRTAHKDRDAQQKPKSAAEGCRHAPPSRDMAAHACPDGAHGMATLASHSCPDGHEIPAVSMCVWPPSKDHYISAGIIKHGRWLLHEDERVRRRIVCRLANASRAAGPSAWLVDVGGNIGTFTLPLLAAGCNVVSFEAFPPNADMLRASAGALLKAPGRAMPSPSPTSASTSSRGQWKFVAKAVSRPGAPPTLCMAAPPANSTQNMGGIALVGGGASSATSGGEPPCPLTARVPATTLDDELGAFFDSSGSGVVLPAMKLDVEGHESQVLRGAHQTFATRPPRTIFVEARGVINRQEIFAFLRNHSYSFAWKGGAQDYEFRRAAAPHEA